MTTQSGVYQCKVEFMGIKAESNNATLEVYGKCSLRIIGTSNTRATRCWVELFPKHFLAMSFFKTKWILKAQTLFQGTMIFFKSTSIIIVWFPVNNMSWILYILFILSPFYLSVRSISKSDSVIRSIRAYSFWEPGSWHPPWNLQFGSIQILP